MEYPIFDTLLDAVFVVDHDWKLVYTNQAGAALAGLTLKRLKPGTSFNEVFKFEPAIAPLDLTEVKKPTRYREVQFVTSTKLEGHLRASIQPDTFKDKPSHWIIFLKDTGLEISLESKYSRERTEKTAVVQVAQRDLVTRLYNRSLFLNLATEAIKNASTTKKPLVLLLVDIDNFKFVNETFGSAAGDWLLTQMGQHLTHTFSEIRTTIGRLEGNAFGVLLPNSTDSVALGFAKKVQRLVSESDFKWAKNQVLRVTVSTGLVSYTGEKTGRDLFDKAWRLLRSSKQNGTNKITMSAV